MVEWKKKFEEKKETLLTMEKIPYPNSLYQGETKDNARNGFGRYVYSKG